MSDRMLMYYFETKDELITEALEFLTHSMAETLGELLPERQTPAADIVKAAVQAAQGAELQASLSLLEIDPTEVIHLDSVLEAIGCNKCQNLGFHGRVGIFELMRMSDDIHGLIIKSASAPEIREVALKQGMTTLQQSGWSQIKRGLTSLSEVVRYADIFAEETGNESFS